MRVLYLFNAVVTGTLDDVTTGKKHDSHLFGMLRLRSHGIDTDYEELEKYLPRRLTRFLRRWIFTMHYAHLPLFPLFFRYDVVFTSTAYSSLILKALLRVRTFKWVILDFNILGTIGEEKTFRQRVFAWAVSKADGIVAISEAEAEALKKRFPNLAKTIIFLHEATDVEYFKPQEGVVEKDVVLSVGNYGRDFDTLIQATEGLGVECRLATKLITPEQAKKLPPHVTVKLYSHEEMKKNYAEAKVVFVGIEKPDTYYDSVGTFAVIESLAMGKPTIVTDTKNMHSYIEHTKNGVLVPYHDVEVLKKEIKVLLDDDVRRIDVGKSAEVFARKNVNAESFASSLAVYFRSIWPA